MEKYIARDKNGTLYLYVGGCPKKGKLEFFPIYGIKIVQLHPSEFPEVTWENSPKKVKISLDDL